MFSTAQLRVTSYESGAPGLAKYLERDHDLAPWRVAVLEGDRAAE
jgi:hypothetical protein